ncbi:MAG TPA: cellulase N-terminal Ig-like domain-containing protein, partial [Flavisolibacter sp.]|nr:cellulase N-terminal Ig-like domain-containing protein [Flavisolibacter sp.]
MMKRNFITTVLILCFGFLSTTLWSQNGSSRIQLNQVGFYPAAPKVALVTGKTEAAKFTVTSPDGRTTYFTGTLSDEKQSAYSSTVTRIADFSAFQKGGTYVISVPEVGVSYPFRIAKDAFGDAAKTVLKGFYFIRSDMPLEAK